MDFKPINIILVIACLAIMMVTVVALSGDSSFQTILLKDIPQTVECKVMHDGRTTVYLCGEEEV